MLFVYYSLRGVKYACMPQLLVVSRVDAVISQKTVKFTGSNAVLHEILFSLSALPLLMYGSADSKWRDCFEEGQKPDFISFPRKTGVTEMPTQRLLNRILHTGE